MGVHFACVKKFGKGSARAERRQVIIKNFADRRSLHHH
jgi:hypothetical protein